MLEVDQVRDCKQLSANGMSIRGIARELKISRNTVRRYLRGEVLPGVYQMKSPRCRPAEEQIAAAVEDLLVTEKESKTPRKQRLTASRVHRLLRAEGYMVSESTVRKLVSRIRSDLRDPLEAAYIPLEYEPGRDAQVDFFEAVVDHVERGREKVFILLVRACYSARTFAYVAPNQTREALLEGLMQAFEFFGGVFRTLWFDNLTPAVKKVLKGRSRVLQRAFSIFQAHYGFNAEFCSAGKGNEKGGVEGQVKYTRHEVLSPIPEVTGRDDVQKLFDAWMKEDANRIRSGTTRTIGELWSEEIPHLIPLPSRRFDAAQVRTGQVSSRSWISHGTNFYSVPVAWVGHEVTVKVEAERIVIHHRNDPCVEHRRCYERHQMVLELEHYLPLLHRKCRGLDRSVPFRRWLEKVEPLWRALLGTLRRQHGEVAGSREFVEIVQMTRPWGLDAVARAVEKALLHPEVSLASVRFHLWRHREQDEPAVQAICYDGPSVTTGNASAYMSLCEGKGGEHE